MSWFTGKKTIIGTVVLGILGVLTALEVITPEISGAVASVVFIFTGISAVQHVDNATK